MCVIEKKQLTGECRPRTCRRVDEECNDFSHCCSRNCNRKKKRCESNRKRPKPKIHFDKDGHLIYPSQDIATCKYFGSVCFYSEDGLDNCCNSLTCVKQYWMPYGTCEMLQCRKNGDVCNDDTHCCSNRCKQKTKRCKAK
ncbi:hypothetical protein Ciccas_002314 [Cichlidogyrus casuarinus]|uniref:WAP domain-containing protein n=1 Tax=Cichlidogyrus casuarinus TaxID=1844966 RepID=A0ABD2QHL4_9PLAT